VIKLYPVFLPNQFRVLSSPCASVLRKETKKRMEQRASMSTLVTTSEVPLAQIVRSSDDRERLEREGAAIVRHLPRVARFAQMLVHPEMAQFLDETMGDWDSCCNTICLIKMGQSLCNMMGGPEQCSGLALAGAMGRVMQSAEHRQAMATMMRQFMGQQVVGPQVVGPQVVEPKAVVEGVESVAR
jgi:hypothetical protein